MNDSIFRQEIDPTPATISVCICTYRRLELLKNALEKLAGQDTGGRFDYSIVVADNDGARSAEPVVAEFAASHDLPVVYCVEPQQNIALARNQALAQARGDFVAFMDDDEFPARNWLATLLKTLRDHRVDGVLGPVRPFFDHPPPSWLIKGGFCDRPEHPTGLALHWKQSRTGNVMFRRAMIEGLAAPFDAEFGNGGEDQDFFRRMMERGHQFVWCNEAVIYEVVPSERCERRYLLKRALLRGQNEKLLLNARSLAKSLIAVPAYIALLSVAWVRGEHVFLKYLIRLLDHLGKLLVSVGIRPVRGPYLMG
jgi:succinoglycan biosynthesis protein ExoM